MSPDFKDLLSILNADNVRYLVVGGYAVSLHAQPRATKDLDILIKPDRANAAALFFARLRNSVRRLRDWRRTTSLSVALSFAWARRPLWSTEVAGFIETVFRPR